MKMLIEHTFDVSPAEYANIYFDEAFNEKLCVSVKLGRTLLRLDRTPTKLVRHVRCEPVREVPAPLAKVLDGHRFNYVEELEFDLETLRGRWRVVPSLLPEKVEAGGTQEFEDVGGKTKRIVRGEVKVSVFGIGGIVERFVVGEVQKSYDDAAAFTRGFLERRGS
jgi:hypothetical protein